MKKQVEKTTEFHYRGCRQRFPLWLKSDFFNRSQILREWQIKGCNTMSFITCPEFTSYQIFIEYMFGKFTSVSLVQVPRVSQYTLNIYLEGLEGTRPQTYGKIKLTEFRVNLRWPLISVYIITIFSCSRSSERMCTNRH